MQFIVWARVKVKSTIKDHATRRWGPLYDKGTVSEWFVVYG